VLCLNGRVNGLRFNDSAREPDTANSDIAAGLARTKLEDTGAGNSHCGNIGALETQFLNKDVAVQYNIGLGRVPVENRSSTGAGNAVGAPVVRLVP